MLPYSFLVRPIFLVTRVGNLVVGVPAELKIPSQFLLYRTAARVRVTRHVVGAEALSSDPTHPSHPDKQPLEEL